MVDENFEFTAQISEGQLVESSQVLAQVPLTGWVNVYKWDKEWSDYGYNRNSVGFQLGLSYPVFNRTRLSGVYLYDVSDIEITDFTKASTNIIKLAGTKPK